MGQNNSGNIKLPFGLNDSGDIVHVSEVPSGKACGCTCPSCGSALVAAKGQQQQHHFRHASVEECAGGLESAIHLAAKKYYMQKREVHLPEAYVIEQGTDSIGKTHVSDKKVIVKKGTKVEFDHIEEEVSIHGIRADLLGTKKGVPLVIEVFFRHKSEIDKIEKLSVANLSALEIDLSDLTPKDLASLDSFYGAVSDPQRMEWLHHSKEKAVRQALRAELNAKINLQEKAYKDEARRQKQREEYEIAKLAEAVVSLRAFSNKEAINQFKDEAENHPLWWRSNKLSHISLDGLPPFVGVEVAHGDWIFGCDRRVWQSALYVSFIKMKKVRKAFSIQSATEWLEKEGCRVPPVIKTVSVLSKKYPEEASKYFLSGKPPSTWKTLREYCDYLSDLGMLSYSPGGGGMWYEVISDKPTRAPSIRSMPKFSW